MYILLIKTGSERGRTDLEFIIHPLLNLFQRIGKLLLVYFLEGVTHEGFLFLGIAILDMTARIEKEAIIQ